jgi:aspartate aminotransferase-like enzyme
LTASGTAAMEACVMNLFTERDKILVVNGGSFGKRFKQICEIHHLDFVSIDLEWDEAFNPESLQQYENAGITGMLLNMCETSTGQLYPMDTISAFCRRNNICLVVDAISSFLCDPFSMKESGASAVIVSSQKGFGLQPGMSFVALTEKACRERCEHNEIESLYFRFTDYVKDMERGQTPYTPAVSIINQLYEKLKRLIHGGIDAHIEYIASLASYFRASLAQTRFAIPNYPVSNCLTPVYCDKNNAQEIVETLKNRHDIYVTPCAGQIAPFLFRAVHMSRQITKGDIDELIFILKEFS